MKRCVPLILLWIAIGCGSAQRSEPLTGPLRLTDPKLREGRQAFTVNCYQCHPGGQAGLGPALNNKPLSSGAIKYQVRHGLGAMPYFDTGKLPDAQLDAIVAYLMELRKHGQ